MVSLTWLFNAKVVSHVPVPEATDLFPARGGRALPSLKDPLFRHIFIATYFCFLPVHINHCSIWTLQTATAGKSKGNLSLWNGVMGQPSSQASYAIIYLTYTFFLYGSLLLVAPLLFWADNYLRLNCRLTGLYIAWHWRKQSKLEFLSSNRTQKG